MKGVRLYNFKRGVCSLTLTPCLLFLLDFLLPTTGLGKSFLKGPKDTKFWIDEYLVFPFFSTEQLVNTLQELRHYYAPVFKRILGVILFLVRTWRCSGSLSHSMRKQGLLTRAQFSTTECLDKGKIFLYFCYRWRLSRYVERLPNSLE